MKTRVLGGAGDEIATAVDYLRRGEVVALPTETVYGLAANALQEDAVLKIFEAKERPRFDPLIVHLPDRHWLERLTNVSETDGNLVSALTKTFWPGALTIVLPRQAIVPDIVTAGLETVAVRLSVHPIFKKVISAFGAPLAAPSANRFGRISPTEAAHVAAELEGRIPLIIDGGRTTHGIESTIVAIRAGGLEVLRQGPITPEQLSVFAAVRMATERERPEAPGQLRSHYAPQTPLVLTSNLASFHVDKVRVGALSLHPIDNSSFAEQRALSRTGDLREAAANLFRCLRELDEAGLDLIVVEHVPEQGLGAAMMDRLRRAAAR